MGGDQSDGSGSRWGMEVAKSLWKRARNGMGKDCKSKKPLGKNGSAWIWSLEAWGRIGMERDRSPEAPIPWLWLTLRNSIVQQELGLTFLVSESKGSGVGVLAFWASSGGGANTRGSPKGRAAAKFMSG